MCVYIHTYSINIHIQLTEFLHCCLYVHVFKTCQLELNKLLEFLSLEKTNFLSQQFSSSSRNGTL